MVENILLEDLKVERERLTHPDGAISVVKKLLLGQGMNEDRVVTTVESKPRECSCETFDGAPDFKTPNDVGTSRTREHSAIDSLRDDLDITLVNKFTKLIADDDCGCAALDVILKVIQVEMVLLNLGGYRGLERVCGRLGRQEEAHGGVGRSGGLSGGRIDGHGCFVLAEC